MTSELTLLIWSGVLTVAVMAVGLIGAILQVGIPTLAGNREDMPALTGWAGRAARAHRNLLENLVLFAILALTAKAVGVSNDMTVLGSQLFFWGRVAHAVLYIAGLPWVRTLSFVASLAGLVLFAAQLV